MVVVVVVVVVVGTNVCVCEAFATSSSKRTKFEPHKDALAKFRVETYLGCHRKKVGYLSTILSKL